MNWIVIHLGNVAISSNILLMKLRRFLEQLSCPPKEHFLKVFPTTCFAPLPVCSKQCSSSTGLFDSGDFKNRVVVHNIILAAQNVFQPEICDCGLHGACAGLCNCVYKDVRWRYNVCFTYSEMWLLDPAETQPGTWRMITRSGLFLSRHSPKGKFPERRHFYFSPHHLSVPAHKRTDGRQDKPIDLSSLCRNML